MALLKMIDQHIISACLPETPPAPRGRILPESRDPLRCTAVTVRGCVYDALGKYSPLRIITIATARAPMYLFQGLLKYSSKTDSYLFRLNLATKPQMESSTL
jgi:hypothetical protein